MFCWTRDITLWRSAWMTSAQLWSRRHHWPWADVIRADFQTVISRYLHNVNTRLFCTADRMFRTIIILNSRLIYACFPIKIDEVWIDRFCVRYDWWRRLQPTSSVSPVWYTSLQNQGEGDGNILQSGIFCFANTLYSQWLIMFSYALYDSLYGSIYLFISIWFNFSRLFHIKMKQVILPLKIHKFSI